MLPADTIAFVGIVLNTVSALTLLITVIIMALQIKEMRRATHATAFKAVYDILEADDVVKARSLVMATLANKPFDSWTEKEKRIAEKVCRSYDAAAIMVRSGMIPVDDVADHWSDSLRKTWAVLFPLVASYRIWRDSGEYWDDYEWLAKQAEWYQKAPQKQEKG